MTPEPKVAENIARNISHLREATGYLQHELAEALGVSPSAVCRWEKGNRVPDLYAVYRVSTFFGVTLDEMFADTPPQPRMDNGVPIDEEALDYARSVDADRARQSRPSGG